MTAAEPLASLTLTLRRAAFRFTSEAEPHVVLRLKRVFGKLSKSTHVALPCTHEHVGTDHAGSSAAG